MSEKSYHFPDDCRYTQSDEWVRVDGNVVRIGITDFAQSELSDIVFVEMPEVGSQLHGGQPFGVVESVKAVSDLNAPISGEVVAVNEDLEENPEFVNEDPYARGWLIAIDPEDMSAFEELMSAVDYAAHVKSRADS